jgi:predicted SprT family Zn-dependent metalloprotease
MILSEQEKINKTNEFTKYVNTLINKYLKKSWYVYYFNSTTGLGLCDHKHLALEFNYDLIYYGSENQKKDTALHEIAHAIDMEKRGKSDHTQIWKSIAKSIGANPSRKSDTSLEYMEHANYIGFCNNCNAKFFRIKKPTRDMIHTNCKTNNDITWKPNK